MRPRIQKRSCSLIGSNPIFVRSLEFAHCRTRPDAFLSLLISFICFHFLPVKMHLCAFYFPTSSKSYRFVPRLSAGSALTHGQCRYPANPGHETQGYSSFAMQILLHALPAPAGQDDLSVHQSAGNHFPENNTASINFVCARRSLVSQRAGTKSLHRFPVH